MMESISVVIPVKNGIRTIQKCIDGILGQTIEVEEIIVVDSGSDDGTVELLKGYPKVELIEIPADEFNHGETRNLGVQHASGKYVALTVQDAWPVNEYWLENMLMGFEKDNVVAVCGQQIVPHETDKNPVQWFRPYSTPVIITRKFLKDEFERLSPKVIKQACSWDNVTALYKKEVLLQIPFKATIFAEDKIWAKDALAHGHAIAYNYAARVYHYHHEDAEFAFKRSYAEIFSTYKIFKLLPEMPKVSLKYYTRLAKSLYVAKGMSFNDKFYWWKYNINLLKSYKQACELFYQMLARGEEELENSYATICKRVLASE